MRVSSLCVDICPMANKENTVVASGSDSESKNFPTGYEIPNPLTATPQSIMLFHKYQQYFFEVSMHEENGDWKNGAVLTARALMLNIVPKDSVVRCGLNDTLSKVTDWKYGGTASIHISGKECPHIDSFSVICGAVSSIVRENS